MPPKRNRNKKKGKAQEEESASGGQQESSDPQPQEKTPEKGSEEQLQQKDPVQEQPQGPAAQRSQMKQKEKKVATQQQARPLWGPPPQGHGQHEQQQARPLWGPPPQGHGQHEQQQARPLWGPPPQGRGQQQQAHPLRGPPPQGRGQQQQACSQWGPPPQGPGQQQQLPPSQGPGQKQQLPPSQGPGQQQQPPPQQQQARSQWGPPPQGSGQQLPPSQGPGQQQQPPSQQQQTPAKIQQMPVKVIPGAGKQPQGTSDTRKSGTIKQMPPEPGSDRIITAKIELPSHMVEKYVAMIPKRRDPYKCGTKGRPITVETNMFSLLLGQNFCPHIIHYDVSIEPDKPKFMMRPVFDALQKKCFPKRFPAFDGKKNAYSAKELPFGNRIEEKVEVYNKEKQKNDEFSIKLKKANEIDLSWLKALKPGFSAHSQIVLGTQALDVILHHGPSSNLVPVGRSIFYPPPREPIYLQNAMELWYGTFISAVAGWKPYLNIDVSHKAFPTSQSVIDTMKELCQINFNNSISYTDVSRNKYTLSKYLKGLKVQHEIPGKPNTKRTHRILGLVETPAKNDRFTTSDGTEYTVVQYFKEQHGYNIVFPDLPCLWVGSVNKKNHIPVELCKIAPGQVTQRTMDPGQTSQMIKHAATNTDMRKRKIMDAVNAVRLNEQPTLRNEFGISVDTKFTQVPARVLQPPSLQYGNNNKPVQPRKGTWWAERFAKPAILDDSCWTFLNLNDRTRDNDLYEFERKLQEHAPKLAMRIGKPATPFITIPARDVNFKKRLFNALTTFKEQNLQLVIVILPYGLDDAYPVVKQCSELGVSVLTQCIKSETLRKLSDSTLGNILQKVNAKLNGINHSFAPAIRPGCLSQPCILIGADVTHPPPDAKDVPSIAAVVASHDSKAFQYNVQVRLQPARMEVILDIENILVEQLNFFRKKTNCLPKFLIFYRDGVSEGQFPQVMHYEIGAMKRAFKRIDPNYNALITFLVVQKRHHTRLFPTDKRNSDDKNFNVQAGTIVDTHITHPSQIDFYLVSHASIQGTAKPTKYRCLFNEIGLSEDDIEELTYYLCHMFARCTRSVSYPAPTYYAHLAAFRGRAYLHAQNICMSKLEEEQKSKLVIRLLHENPMFFV